MCRSVVWNRLFRIKDIRQWSKKERKMKWVRRNGKKSVSDKWKFRINWENFNSEIIQYEKFTFNYLVFFVFLCERWCAACVYEFFSRSWCDAKQREDNATTNKWNQQHDKSNVTFKIGCFCVWRTQAAVSFLSILLPVRTNHISWFY